MLNFNDCYTLHKVPPESLINIDPNTWEHDVIRAVLKLLDDANIKYKKLLESLVKNPYLPFYHRIFIQNIPKGKVIIVIVIIVIFVIIIIVIITI